MNDPDVAILAALVGAGREYVSGSALGAQLGLSRVAVWGRLQKLQKSGLEIEAIRNRGYRLRGEPGQLHADLVRAHLHRQGREVGLIHFPEIDSTNSEAERQLASGREVPFAVLAGQQTAGRGRRGRQWHSPEEGNIYLTLAFRPQMAPGALSRFTLWAGLAVARLLEEEYGVRAQLKWPNDLLLNGKKAGGMLAEARVDADRARDLLFGLGLNVNSRPTRWPDQLRAVATSLCEACGHPLELSRLAAGLVGAVVEAFETLGSESMEQELLRRWEHFDGLRGQEVEAMLGTETLRGTAAGIDAHGRLLLDTPEGTRALSAGEVTLGTGRRHLS